MVEHTSITNFNEILKKLPVLPVEWVDDEEDTKNSNIPNDPSSLQNAIGNKANDVTSLTKFKGAKVAVSFTSYRCLE